MSIAQQAAGEGMALGIYLQQERVLIGGIGMHNWQHDQKRAQIGYWIAKGYEGRGLMTRSAERFVDFLFRKIGLNKIEIHSLPHNERSLAIAFRLGAKIEGCIRQSYLTSGKLEDIVITGILRREWEAAHGPATGTKGSAQ